MSHTLLVAILLCGAWVPVGVSCSIALRAFRMQPEAPDPGSYREWQGWRRTGVNRRTARCEGRGFAAG